MSQSFFVAIVVVLLPVFSFTQSLEVLDVKAPNISIEGKRIDCFQLQHTNIHQGDIFLLIEEQVIEPDSIIFDVVGDDVSFEHIEFITLYFPPEILARVETSGKAFLLFNLYYFCED
ncbi:MAG: hypothetical protein AAF806_28995 [Bacteroidota bacterium]